MDFQIKPTLSSYKALKAGTMALLLDDKQYKALPENKRSLYLLQWLQRLPGVIKNTTRVSTAMHTVSNNLCGGDQLYT